MNLTPLPSPAPAPASSLPCPCRYRSHLITPPPSSPHLRVHQIPAPTHRILTPPTCTHPCRARRITPPLYPCPLQHYQRAHLAPTHPVFTPALPLLQPNPCTPLHPHTPRIVHTSSHPAPLTACTHPPSLTPLLLPPGRPNAPTPAPPRGVHLSSHPRTTHHQHQRQSRRGATKGGARKPHTYPLPLFSLTPPVNQNPRTLHLFLLPRSLLHPRSHPPLITHPPTFQQERPTLYPNPYTLAPLHLCLRNDMTSLCNHCNLLSPHTPAYTRAPRHPVFASATTPHPTPRARRTPSFPLYSAGKPEPPPTAPTHLPTSTPCITTSDRPRLRTPFANIPTSRKAEKLAYQETNTPRSRKPGKLENQEAKKSETWKVGKPAHATTTRSSTHPKTTALTATGNHRSGTHT